MSGKKGIVRSEESKRKQSISFKHYWSTNDPAVLARKARLGAMASARMKARWAEIKRSSAVNESDEDLLK